MTKSARRRKHAPPKPKQPKPTPDATQRRNKRPRNGSYPPSNEASPNSRQYPPAERPYALDRFQQQLARQIVRQLALSPAQEKVLPRVILKLSLKTFNPRDEAKRIKIFENIHSELVDSVGGKKAANKRRKQELAEARANGTGTSNGQSSAPLSPQSPQQRRKGRTQATSDSDSPGRKKSGKFQQLMVARGGKVGAVLVSYMDARTLQTLVRTEGMFFIALRRGILTAKQRLATYVSPRDISYRCRRFNDMIDAESSLVLYELLRASQVSTRRCLALIMAHALGSAHPELFIAAKLEKAHVAQLDASLRGLAEAAESKLQLKSRQLDVWLASDVVHDFNAAYFTEFAEFQRQEQGDDNGDHEDTKREEGGRRWRDLVARFVVDRQLVSMANVRSLHCAYQRMVGAQQAVYCYIWIFVELRVSEQQAQSRGRNSRNSRKKAQNDRKEMKQFMVWKAQCGLSN